MFGVPDISEIFGRLDDTTDQMKQLVEGTQKIVELLQEQNEILRGWSQRV